MTATKLPDVIEELLKTSQAMADELHRYFAQHGCEPRCYQCDSSIRKRKEHAKTVAAVREAFEPCPACAHSPIGPGWLREPTYDRRCPACNGTRRKGRI